MSKILGTVAAAAMLVAFAVPGPAAAGEREGATRDAGIHKHVTDFSSQRRVYRRHYYVRRYVRPRYYGYGYPYYYGYGYPYYRPYPYYAPGAYFRFGPFGFGVW